MGVEHLRVLRAGFASPMRSPLAGANEGTRVMGTTIKSLGTALALAGTLGCSAAAQTVLPPINVTSTRLGDGITGASTTVITAEDIARSPGESLQSLLGREPGIQTWSTYGGVNGAGTVVDMRGFGVTAASNTLVLLNGRRLTDIDLAGVDFSAIPRDSIERIEITRGNSGAVLYGDGAVGGVINIVTKTGVAVPPSARVEGGWGTFNQREAAVSVNTASGPYSASVFSNSVNSDGYRVNNALRQINANGDLRYTTDQGSAYFNVAADDQHIGLPGARLVTVTSSLVDTDRRGATTPSAFAEKQGINVTMGFTRMVAQDFELIVDGSYREKQQRAFSSLSGTDSSDKRALATASFTPRFVSRRGLLGFQSKVITGLDFYDASLRSDRSRQLSEASYHRYDLTQQSIGLYWQQTVGIVPSTDVSWGTRIQTTKVSAKDRFDAAAPGADPFDSQASRLDFEESQYAAHLGLEHRFSDAFAMFGRVARSFRTPTVDERIGVNAFPVDFKLRTQTSMDKEIGVRVHLGAFDLQSSVYEMLLTDEILFIPFPPTGANVNLDPTRRTGFENIATYRVSDASRLKGALSFTRAVFREGTNSGHDVPLVSRWTGSVGVSWDVWKKWVVADVAARYIGSRRMDNDQPNTQPLIGEHTLVDVRLGGEIEKFFWSVAVQNVFDVAFFDYAIASASTAGRYNAYPMPGRTVMVKAGSTF
jgi:iron complex outermembrane receptor protein